MSLKTRAINLIGDVSHDLKLIADGCEGAVADSLKEEVAELDSFIAEVKRVENIKANIQDLATCLADLDAIHFGSKHGDFTECRREAQCCIEVLNRLTEEL